MYPILHDLNVRDDLKNCSVEDITKLQNNSSLPYSVGVINLNGDLNIGMIMRSAVLFCAKRIFIFGNKRYDKRSAVGAHNYLEAVYVKTDKEDNVIDRSVFDDAMTEYDCTPVFIEQSGVDIRAFEFGLVKHPCLIFGNEGYGIPSDFIRNDLCINIPQGGVMRSLNVSAAAAISMFSCYTQLSG